MNFYRTAAFIKVKVNRLWLASRSLRRYPHPSLFNLVFPLPYFLNLVPPSLPIWPSIMRGGTRGFFSSRPADWMVHSSDAVSVFNYLSCLVMLNLLVIFNSKILFWAFGWSGWKGVRLCSSFDRTFFFVFFFFFSCCCGGSAYQYCILELFVCLQFMVNFVFCCY
jgi:hypothetical protein